MTDQKPTYRYARYLARVTRAPWCLLPEKMADIRQLMALRLSAGRLSDQEIAARIGDEADRAAEVARVDGAIAILPVHGTIAYRADSFELSSGGASVENLNRRLDQFLKDESVKAIVLDIDSPGGSVDGVPELAAKIAKARKTKPIFAIANSLAASAAFWLGTQADELSVIPSGMVGSIGVYMLLIDESGWLAKEGITINAISAGENKLEGAWWQELSDESRAHFQGQVDDIYKQFVKAVASGRGATTEQVEERMGQGRVYDAKEALKRGMVDQVETLDQLLARLSPARPKGKAARADVAADAATMDTGQVSPDDGLVAGASAPPTAEASDAWVDQERMRLDLEDAEATAL